MSSPPRGHDHVSPVGSPSRSDTSSLKESIIEAMKSGMSEMTLTNMTAMNDLSRSIREMLTAFGEQRHQSSEMLRQNSEIISILKSPMKEKSSGSNEFELVNPLVSESVVKPKEITPTQPMIELGKTDASVKHSVMTEDERLYVPPPLRIGSTEKNPVILSQVHGPKRNNGNGEGVAFSNKNAGKQPMGTLPPTLGGQGEETSKGRIDPHAPFMPGGHGKMTPINLNTAFQNSGYETHQNPMFVQDRERFYDGFNRTPVNHIGQPNLLANNFTVDRNELINMVQEAVASSIPRKMLRPSYRKPYPDWIDQNNEIPRGYKVPEFSLFSGEGLQSTIEHVGRFTMQCGELSGNDNLKLRLFGNSLTGPAFSWYIGLPPNSILNWRQMEEKFHTQFFKSEPEVSMVDLATLRQLPGELAEQYISRFNRARNRCRVMLPEAEFVKLAQNGLEIELRKKFEGMDFEDLFELAARAARYERLLREDEQRKASSYGTYYQDPNFEIDLVEVISRKPFVCQALDKKEMEAPKTFGNRKSIMDSDKKFSFDISKASEIFDHLLSGKFIRLLDGHRMPTMRAGQFCKWHGTPSHDTNDCNVFRNVIQENIDKGLLKFPEKKKEAMAVDTDPFPIAEIAVAQADLRSLCHNRYGQGRWRSYFQQAPGRNFIKTCQMQRQREIGQYWSRDYQGCARCRGRVINDRIPLPNKQEYRPFNNVIHTRQDRWEWRPKQMLRRDASSGWGQRSFKPEFKRMVKPPLTKPEVWTRLEHPKFPETLTRTQKRREQRKRAGERQYWESKRVQEEVQRSGAAVTKTRRVLTENDKETKQTGPTKEGIVSILKRTSQQSPDRSGIFPGKGKEKAEEVPSPKSQQSRKSMESISSTGSFNIQFGTIPKVVNCSMAFTLPLVFQARHEAECIMEREDMKSVGERSIIVEEVEKINANGDVETSENIVFEKPAVSMTRHLRPLYIKVHMNGTPVQRVLIDNGAAVNILPSFMLKKLGKGEKDLLPTEITVSNFSGGVTKTKGILPVSLTVGSKECLSAFFVVNSTSSYNALLGRDWIHSNWCVPSSLHQFLILWNGNRVEVIWADQRPFVAGSNAAEACLYGPEVGPIRFTEENGKGRVKEVKEQEPLFKEDLVAEVVREITRPNVITLPRPGSGYGFDQ